jgi:hypothetical protein
MTPRRFWLMFGGIFLAVGAPFLAIGVGHAIHQSLLAKRLDREGQQAQGLVLTREIREDDSGSTCRVSYRFSTPGGEPLTGSTEVDDQAWDALVERGPIQVTYLSGDPRSHVVTGQRRQVLLPAVFSVLGGILTVLGSMVLIRARPGRDRTRRSAGPLTEES